MKKIYFLITLLFGFSIGLFIFSYQEVKAQVGTGNQCYAGTWMQPTCNPVTSDPSSCNILPPLFSGAACDQHTGYLRVQDEANGTAQANWTQLFPGKILVGDVAGGWVTPGGSIEIYGPVVSGNFALATDVPVGFKESGDFAAQRDIYAGGSLRVAGNSSFYGSINAYNRVNITASANTGNLMTITNSAGIGANATTVAIIQTPGSVGNILSLDTADNNRVYVDQLGYLNATKDFQIRIDADNNFTQNYFRINDGANATVFQVAEDGSAQIAGDASVAKTLSAGSIVANSPSAGRGKIWGNFTDLNNNNCSADQLLVYRGAPFTPGWYCVSATNVGTTTVGNLLQTLQAGADASVFDQDVSIGTGLTGFTIVSADNVSGPTLLNLKNRKNIILTNEVMGDIRFDDANNDIDQAKIEVSRGAPGGVNDYPTNMSFWTTPDGSNIPQERLTILHNGNIGIGRANPLALLELYEDGSDNAFMIQYSGACRFLSANNSSAGGISIGSCATPPNGGLYVSGNTGIGTNIPAEKLEVNDSGLGTARLRITDTGQNAELQLKYGAVDGQHWAIYTANTTDDSLRVWGGGNDQMVIRQTGAISGKFADGDGNLCANNQILVYNSGTSKWVCSSSIPGGSQDLLSVLGAGSNASTYTANTSIGGNLGLGGISNPTYSIHVNKNNAPASLALETTGTGRNSYIELRNSDTSQIPYIDLTKGWTGGNTPDFSGRIAYWSDNDFQIIQANNNPLSFWTNNTKRMTIAGNGFVGIGIDPTSMFQINGAAGTGWNSGLKITRADQIGADFRINVTTGDTLFRNFSAGTGYAFRNSADASLLNILSDGKVGIGYNPPTSKLTVGATNNVEGVRIISSNYSPFVIRDTANTIDYFRIRENGVVEGNPLNLKSTSYINFMTDNESTVKASLSTVNGESIFSSPRIETTSINHKETILQASEVTLYFKSNCNGCAGGGGGGARNIDTGLLERLAKYADYIFAIPSANALPICYYNCFPTSAADCSTLGNGWYEVSQVYPYTFTENALGCSSAPPDYCQNNTQSWPNLVYSRTCRKDSGGEALYTKIEFNGSPAGGFPGVTKVKDNLVVEQNLYGDGVTTGCVWVDGGANPKMCAPGKFVGGVNFSNSQIYCCDL